MKKSDGRTIKKSNWKGKTKKRCIIKGCRKRAKDEGLCRIHSPQREGYGGQE